jgi:hypothetical protein
MPNRLDSLVKKKRWWNDGNIDEMLENNTDKKIKSQPTILLKTIIMKNNIPLHNYNKCFSLNIYSQKPE